MSRYIFIFRSRTRTRIFACHSMDSLDYAREPGESASTWTNAQTAYIHAFLNFMLSSYSICWNSAAAAAAAVDVSSIRRSFYIFNRCSSMTLFPIFCARKSLALHFIYLCTLIWLHCHSIWMVALWARACQIIGASFLQWFCVHTVYWLVGGSGAVINQTLDMFVYSCVCICYRWARSIDYALNRVLLYDAGIT